MRYGFILLSFQLVTACVRQLPIVEDDPSPDQAQPNTPEAALVSAVDNTLPEYVLPKPAEFLRIDLQRDGDTVSLLSLSRMTSSLRPSPNLAAEYMLVAKAGGKPLAVVPVGFPRTVDSFHGKDMPRVSKPLTISHATVFVDAQTGLDALSIVRHDQTVALEISSSQLAALTQQSQNAPPGIGKKAEPLGADTLGLLYPHIRTLHQEDADLVPPQLLNAGSVIDPPQELLSQLAAALRTLPPALLSAINTIVTLSHPATNVTPANFYLAEAAAWASGSMLIFNVPIAQKIDAKTLMHEAAHAFNFLMNSPSNNTQSPTNPSGFSTETLAQAAMTIQRYHLADGLSSTWQDLHQSGVEAGLFDAYLGSDFWKNGGKRSGAPATRVGAATDYGLTDAWEDFAEYVAEAGTNASSELCNTISQAEPSDPKNGLMLAKLLLAMGVGAISKPAAQACFAGADLEPTKSGVEFFDVSGAIITFDQSLRTAATEAQGKPSSYEITASGPKGFRTRIALTAEGTKAGSIIGVHKIDDTVFGPPPVNLVALLNDAQASTRGSQSGLAVMMKQHDDALVGVIYGLRMQNYLGVQTDHFPIVNIKAP